MALLVHFLLILQCFSFLEAGYFDNSSSYQKLTDLLGWKIGYTFPFGSYDASDFESRLFGSLYFESSDNNSSFVIPHGNPAVYYNDRNYHWSRDTANNSHFSNQEDTTICEYSIGDDYAELEKVQFANGTKVRSLYFECDPRKSKCCGMYCCRTGFYFPTSAIILLLFALLSILGFLGCLITCFCSRISNELCCCRPKRKQQNDRRCEKYCCNDYTSGASGSFGETFDDSDIECRASSSVECP